jgi:hypothetical protein
MCRLYNTSFAYNNCEYESVFALKHIQVISETSAFILRSSYDRPIYWIATVNLPNGLVEWLTLLLHYFINSPRFECRPRDRLSRLRFFRVFPQSFQANAGIVPFVRQQPLPFTFFLIHHSCIVLSLNAMYSELLNAHN